MLKCLSQGTTMIQGFFFFSFLFQAETGEEKKYLRFCLYLYCWLPFNSIVYIYPGYPPVASQSMLQVASPVNKTKNAGETW